jgi:monoamine oxidase
MANMINSLLESANPYQSVQKDAARLASKWGKSGLLEGLGETDKSNMAIMLESQAKQLVVENNTTGTGASFSAGSGEQYAAVALPLVRKIFGQIAAKEFVSVQPMSLPAGLVFFLDFKYGTSKAPVTNQVTIYAN